MYHVRRVYARLYASTLDARSRSRVINLSATQRTAHTATDGRSSVADSAADS